MNRKHALIGLFLLFAALGFMKELDWKDFLFLPDAIPSTIPEIRILGDTNIFEIYESSPEIEFQLKQPGYVMVFHINAEQKILMLWPDRYLDAELNNYVEAGKKVTIPAAYTFKGEYSGREFLQIITFTAESENLKAKKEEFADLAYTGKYIDPSTMVKVLADPIEKGELTRKGLFSSNMTDFYYEMTPDLKEVTFSTPAGVEFLFVDGILTIGEKAKLEAGNHLITYYYQNQRKDTVINVGTQPTQRVQISLTGIVPPEPSKPVNKALLLSVGISSFQLPPVEIPYLKGPQEDARQFLTTFLSILQGMGFTQQTKLLINEAATRPQIWEGLDWLLKNVDKNTDVFFFYSGHGTQLPDQNGDEKSGFDQALVPYDYDGTAAMVLLDDDLYKIYSQIASKARNFVLLMDACYSGGLFKGEAIQQKGIFFAGIQSKGAAADVPENEMQELTKMAENVFFLSAAKSNEKALDALPGDKYSPFTKYLLQGLEAEGKKPFSLVDLYSYVEKEMNQLFLNRYPAYKHTPVYLRNPNHDFIINF